MRLLIFFLFIPFLVSANDSCQNLDKNAISQGARFNNTQNIYRVGGEGRLQFYSAPDKKCLIDHVFVIPGDSLIAYIEYEDFYRVMYLSRNNEQVSGWVEKNRLSETHKGIAPDYNTPYPTEVNTVTGSSDFTVMLNDKYISLGEKWDEQVRKRAGAQISESFVGDISVGESYYKYYQHNYDGFEIYTANIFWQKEHRDIDSYIISQITFDEAGFLTSRGVSVGDSQQRVVEKYGQAKVDNSDNQHWLYYDGDGKRLSFQIINDKVSRIMLALNPDENGI
ncbi:hypothetical protein SC171_13540 [Pantoea cypripedii]|uniref:hypothetical protein n=1 Tax=Pantoea cypripedii TaxID=55209 RepID=UPI002FC8D543